MKRLFLLAWMLPAMNCIAQNNFITANQFFDDGRKGVFSNENKRVGDLIVGLIEDYTGEYVSFRKIILKPDGKQVTDADVIPGKGIYRKKGSEFFKMNFDGGVNISWFGALPDGKTDNVESIKQALAISGLIKIPVGSFAIASPITINSSIEITGHGSDHSKIICLDPNMSAFQLGEKGTVTNLSRLRFADFSIIGGKYGIAAVRETGNQLIIERSTLRNINFENQSTAAIFLRGKKLLFLVNTIQETIFRYCGTGLLLDDVYSANLNHILLNRFEGTVGGIQISTSQNEMSQLTIHKNRFEAITRKGNIASPIYLRGGNQNVSIADNYFEDVPDPVIHIDAANGVAISPSIQNNQFSANIKGAVMIKLGSQVKSPYIGSNVFKPGQKGIKLDFSPFVSQPIIQSNYGEVEFLSYPIPYSSFEKLPPPPEKKTASTKKTLNHTGNFNFDLKLPSPGVYDVTVAIADDGDFSLGGFSTYKLIWLKAGAPLLQAQEVSAKNNPNTLAIRLSSPTAEGYFTVDVQKADRKSRIATCYISINPLLDIDLTNLQRN